MVDPKDPQEDDFQKAQEEISCMMAKVTQDDDDDAGAPPAPEPKTPAAAPTPELEAPLMATDVQSSEDPKELEVEIAETDTATPKAGPSSARSSSMDDAVMVESDPKREAAAELLSMGFADVEVIEHVIEKNGPDVEACARDLVVASEWDSLLSDLHDMGFENRSLNKKLMVKHNGSVKRTVRDLVAESEF